ncbi:MAG: FGGY-family carbohydrate kinase [Thermomicrobiales bacterium]
MTRCAYLGIDLGTQGVRVVALGGDGELIATSMRPFANVTAPTQDPRRWLDHALYGLAEVAAACAAQGASIRSLSFSGTSGTVVPLDRKHQPVAEALMYHDTRSREVAAAISERTGVRMNASWGLPKIAWFHATKPDLGATIAGWRHPNDLLLGALTGRWDITDEGSALKTGYDLEARAWVEPVLEAARVDRDLLPKVVPSGSVVAWGISSIPGMGKTAVVSGSTDGVCSHIASGAMTPGAWNTTLGTTMVIKGVSEAPIRDPEHRIYNHRHPDGGWIPGAASATGAGWITSHFSGHGLDEITTSAATHIPTTILAWPLHTRGERFPFPAPDAHGFFPDDAGPSLAFAAGLEGVAFLERMAYTLLASLGAQSVGPVGTTGGGSRNTLWTRIRSAVLDRPIVRVRQADAAVGAAILGAASVDFSSLAEAGRQLIIPDGIVIPDRSLVEAYRERYGLFVDHLVARGDLVDGSIWR